MRELTLDDCGLIIQSSEWMGVSRTPNKSLVVQAIIKTPKGTLAILSKRPEDPISWDK